MDVLAIQEISKHYGTVKAVDQLSFAVPQGSIFGLLGPNGAGKTTTIRMIMNIIMPDAGKILFQGQPNHFELLSRIGYLPEERGLYEKMKVLEMLHFFGELKGMEKSRAKESAAYWLKRLEMTEWQNHKVRELSKGMQQKIQFIVTIINDPVVIILDEPFTGLDPINTNVLKNIIQELHEAGKTIIFSTHIMDQVEKLCDRIVLINKGKNILDGHITDIKKKFREKAFHLFLDGPQEGDISAIPGVKEIIDKQGYVKIMVEESQDLQEVGRTLMARLPVRRFEIAEPSLDEIFIRAVESGK